MTIKEIVQKVFNFTIIHKLKDNEDEALARYKKALLGELAQDLAETGDQRKNLMT